MFSLLVNAFQRFESKQYLEALQRNLDETNKVNSIPKTNKTIPRKELLNNGFNIIVFTDCCQSVEEIIQPRGGVSRNGRILEVYRDENSTQNFYQVSCKEKGKRCGRPRPGSKGWPNKFHCVQKYSYTYALVREFNAPESHPWRLDYIRIRNGCSCEQV